MLIRKLAVDNAGPYAITPQQPFTARIEVRENFASSVGPTTDLNQYDDSDSVGARGCIVVKGTSAIFSQPKKTMPSSAAAWGYINTASGSITVAIIEHDKI